jgi:YidC/Oxa1 family membrane protein insertase
MMNSPHGPQGGGMHPQDMRNMIVFILLAIGIWFAFEHFFIKPKMDALKQQAQIERAAAPVTAIAPATALSRDEVMKTSQRLEISAPQLKGTLTLTGNRIDDLELVKFFNSEERKDDDHVILFSPAGAAMAHYAEISWLSDNQGLKLPNRDTVWRVTGANKTLTPDTPVTLTWDNGAGLVFERTLKIDRNFAISVTQKVTNNSDAAVTLFPYAALVRQGAPPHAATVGYEGPLGVFGAELEEVKYTDILKDGAQNFSAQQGWIGFGEKYWLSALLPQQNQTLDFSFRGQASNDPEDKKGLKGFYQLDVRAAPIVIAPQGTGENTMHVFAGAKQLTTLELYEDSLGVPHFDLAIDFGMLYFLTRPMQFLLTLFNSWVGNFGIAIILLTLVVRAAVFPLANTSYRSFAGLRKIAPKMAELKVKYGDDRARMQQELVKLYETEKVNPMAGCFPLLLQIPIFFAVYKVISISIDMRHAPFFGWIKDLSVVDPLSIFNLFGLLKFDVPQFLLIGPWSLAMLALMLLQKKLNPPPTDQIQRDIANWMPWIITLTMAHFPSGLVIYWTFSNLLSVIQQYVIMRSMGVPVYLFEKDAAIAHNEQYTLEAQQAAERAREERAKLEKKKDVKEGLFDAPDPK